MGIWITGDFHGDPYRLSADSFYEQKCFGDDVTENVVIQLGDFGILWEDAETQKEREKLDWLNERNFTTVFVDGNHENFRRLQEYPVKEWCGGCVHEIRPNVLHLMRGEVYELHGKTFFAFGGASSHDIADGIIDPADFSTYEEFEKEVMSWWRERKQFRIKDVSWWEEEMPNIEEMKNGMVNLMKHGMKVDYIISHSPPASVIDELGKGEYVQDTLSIYLEQMRQRMEFKMHFMGHMHRNMRVNDKDIILYEQIVQIVE